MQAYYAHSGLAQNFDWLTRGDALRFASRLPLAVIFRAFGAAGNYLKSYAKPNCTPARGLAE